MLAGTDVMARFSDVSLPATASVLYQPDAGVVAADRAVRSMVDLAVAAGTVLRERGRVLSLRPVSEQVEVSTAEESVRAPVAVVTAGAWARSLLSGTGVELPVIPTRETVGFFPSPSDAAFPIFVEWTEGPLYALPSPGQGLKTGWHHSGQETDPDQPGAVEARVIDRMSSWVQERFPGADPEHRDAESCLYTNTDDERFILQRHGPIVVGSACSGHAFKFAPLIGERLARLALRS
jgi:sarcosine oxidase